MKKLVFIASAVLFVLFALSSCSRSLGYSVVLWSMPEYDLQDGEIVHVLIKSNISQVYVIEKENKKIEIPFWKLSNPVSKSKAKDSLARYEEFQHKYALVALDGLPMRTEPVNTAKQVYRLRESETVRVLYKGKGQPVMAGKKAMPGDWLQIMTDDGTQGWCFSYNLRLFDERDGKDSLQQAEKVDPVLAGMLEKRWWPESYSTMISSGQIDLESMNTNFGFVTGSVTKQVRLALKNLSVNYPFEGVTTKSPNVYEFNKTPITVTVRTPNFIILQYVNDKGIPISFNMVTLKDSIVIEDIIKTEKNRRNSLWTELRSGGVNYISSNYGIIQFLENKQFIWGGYQLLTPDFIPSTAGSDGTADFKYFLSNNLSNQFDGIITFSFSGSSNEINFFYKREIGGLRLESAKGAGFKGNVVNSRSSSPMVIFFSRD